VNIGDPWPDLYEAEWRVLGMQTKLYQWAVADPGRRFDDLANLVYDPAFLVVAWARVRGNKGARTAGAQRRHVLTDGPHHSATLRPGLRFFGLRNPKPATRMGYGKPAMMCHVPRSTPAARTSSSASSSPMSGLSVSVRRRTSSACPYSS